MSVRTTDDATLDELELKIEAQVQRLEGLLGQARIASAELRLTMQKVAPLLGEDPSSPGDGKRREQLD